MTLAHNALSDLEALAYEAALEPSLWPQVVADASHAFKTPYMMLGVVDRRGSAVMHAVPPGQNELAEVMMARYPTCETNPGLAFAALAPHRSRAARPNYFRFRSRAARVLPRYLAAVRSMARRNHERAS